MKENLIKRLSLNNKKINSIINSIKTILNFKDPVDRELAKWIRPNKLKRPVWVSVFFKISLSGVFTKTVAFV